MSGRDDTFNNNNIQNIENPEEDKYYEDDNSMNVSYGEIETCKYYIIYYITNLDSPNIPQGNYELIYSNVIPNPNQNNRETFTNDFSNINVYSDDIDNQMDDSSYYNRNFDNNLDEIFDNLAYMINTEK
jgi:hypothetical protein